MANYEVKLKDGSNYLFPQSMLTGIDFSNVLATSVTTYTATQDCFVYQRTWGGRTYTVGGVSILPSNSGIDARILFVPLKKGQVYYNTGEGNKVYGAKR